MLHSKACILTMNTTDKIRLENVNMMKELFHNKGSEKVIVSQEKS